MKYKAIIFDRDGTLFNSLPVILRSFNYGIEPFTSKRPTDAEWFAAFGPDEQEVMGKFIPADKKPEAFKRFFEYYQGHFSEIQLYPHVREMLARVKQAVGKIALFTGGGRTSTEFCLREQKILYYFDVLITGDEVINPKPHPEGILKALQTLSVDAHEAMIVGDAGADILAGKDAGVTTVLARWGGAPPFDLPSRPDYIFNTVSAFEEFLFR
ncbi:MAG: hypothetical protein C5B54_04425 [Acidobacteria bacterium]|nr:MAG: hypothetical protein C5B54_04425 [Acidobacteriota bacterium]